MSNPPPTKPVLGSKKLGELDERYGIFRAAKFGIAGAAGFLVAELIIIVGSYAIYRRENVSSVIYASPTLLGLNIAAFVIGVIAGFFINEKITVRKVDNPSYYSVRQTGFRLSKYEGVYALGNAITIGVELGLLRQFSLAPAIGSVIGAIIAFPISYVFSMKIVWRLSASNNRPIR